MLLIPPNLRHQDSQNGIAEDTAEETEESNQHHLKPPPPCQQKRNRVPPQQRTQQTNDSERQYNPYKIGRCMWDSFQIVGLGVRVSKTNVKVQYRALLRIYHPVKHKPEQTVKKTNGEATTLFQLI